MQEANFITIISKRKKIMLNINTILYVLMNGKKAEIHVLGDKIYETRMTLATLKEELGEGFIKIHRGCIVSVMAIHDITDSVNLSNGESLGYTIRKKSKIIDQFRAKQKSIVSNIVGKDSPTTEEEYHKYYNSFDNLPFAFTDIEIVFNEKRLAVDWIFRYGNSALATLEKIPLEQLIGNSFGNLFANMDSKWLKSYERAAMYGETLEIMDYSPEVGAYLKIICFPTFKGHCGCILFNLSGVKFVPSSKETEEALMLDFGKLMKEKDKKE